MEKIASGEKYSFVIEFKDEDSLDASKSNVEYSLRLNTTDLELSGYHPFVNTYKQVPNYNSKQFVQKFLSYQTLINDAICDIRGVTNPKLYDSLQVRQFPNLEYKIDNKITFLKFMFPLMFSILFVFSIISQIRLLLEERESRTQHALMMAGLDERVWYASWQMLTFLRSLFTGVLVGVVVRKFILVKHDPLTFAFIIFVFLTYISIVVVASTAIYDKSDSGTAAILMTLCFLGLPFIFWSTIPAWLVNLFCYIFPPGVLIQVGNLLVYSESVYYSGFRWSNLFDPNASSLGFALGPILINMIIASIVWYFGGYYMNKIWPHAFGTPEDPLYFLKKKTNQTITPAEGDDFAADSPASSNPSFEPVADDIRKRNGVHIRGIGKTFPPNNRKGNPVVAVKDFDGDLYEGQITVLLGHNGAGKSTLISVLTGLYGASQGEAKVYGVSLTNQLKKVQSILGVCPQQNVFLNNLTCEQNLLLFGRLRNVPEESLNKLVDEALTDVNLMEKKLAPAKTLSGGMKRRLNVAIAFIGEPKVVFLDEPTSGMDPVSRRDIWALLEKKKEGRVIVLCTHFMDEADFLGDRILVMNHGQLQVAGTSLFLKGKYGIGYHLHVDKVDKADDSGILKEVQQFIPEAVIEESSSLVLSVLLPRDRVNVFGDVLDTLNSKRAELCISGVGMSASTLEEVFLNLASEKHDGSELPKPDTVEDSHPKEEEEDMEKKKSLSSSPTHSPLSPLVDYKKSFPVVNPSVKNSELKVLLWKRSQYSRYEKKDVFQQLFMPTCATVMGFVILLVGGALFGMVPTYSIDMGTELLLPSPVKLQNLPYIYHDADSKTLMDKYVLSASYPLSEKGVPTPIEFMQDVNITDPTSIGSKLIETGDNAALIEIRDSNQMTLWFNTSFTCVLPIMTSILSSSVLNTEMSVGSSNLSIQTNYDVIPDLSDATRSPSVATAIVESFMAMYVLTGFTLYPVYCALPIAKERITQARLQQRLMGVWDVNYWLSCFLWDMLIAVIPILFYVVCSFIFTFDLIEVVFPCCIIIACLIATFLPLAYVLQHMCSSVGQCESQLMNLFQFLLMPNVIINAFMNNVSWMKENRELISTILYFIPSNPAVDSFTMIYRAASNNRGLSAASKEPLYTWQFLWKAVVYMLGETIVFWFILIFVERRSWVRIGNVKHTYADVVPNDSDIQAEAERVDASDHSDAITIKHLWKVYPSIKKAKSSKKGGGSGSGGDSAGGDSGSAGGGGSDKDSTEKQAVEACRDVTFGVKPGDCFGLLGPNGAGKTSLLSILVGIMGYNKGGCWITNYQVPGDVMKAYKILGYCPQFDVLFDYLTTYECLWFYAVIMGIDKELIHDMVLGCLDCLDLTDHKDKLTKELSGGNKRRLCTAIAFLGNPSVIVMDEPSTGLDPMSRRKLWNIIKYSSNERSFLLTTHLMEEADALCNRIAIMVNGQLMCLGSAQHLKTRYGQGYTLDIKLNEDKESMKQLYSLLERECGKFEIREEHGSHAIVVLSTQKPLSDVFRLLESHRDELKVVDYTLSQASLEQIFLQFARNQREDFQERNIEELTKSGTTMSGKM